MRILTFSASPRKIWVNEITKILNPSYWLLGRLMASLAEDHQVFAVADSMIPIGRMRPWNGERVDKVVVMGCSYDPGSLQSSFKPGYIRQKRAFDIAEKIQPALKSKPEIILLSVDVRPWFPEATSCFGFEPHRIIDEQTMRWQQVGFLVASGLAKTNRLPRERRFAFCGGAKNRQDKMVSYLSGLQMPAVVHGGGWDSSLGQMSHVTLAGFQPYHASARLMLSSQYSVCLHEPVGEEASWITARFYENLGCGLVNFTDHDYDKDKRVLPHDHPLRVRNGEELAAKIAERSYDEWIELQNALINPDWCDWRGWYYEPFLKKLDHSADAK